MSNILHAILSTTGCAFFHWAARTAPELFCIDSDSRLDRFTRTICKGLENLTLVGMVVFPIWTLL